VALSECFGSFEGYESILSVWREKNVVSTHFQQSGRFFKLLQFVYRPEQGAGELGPLAGFNPSLIDIVASSIFLKNK